MQLRREEDEGAQVTRQHAIRPRRHQRRQVGVQLQQQVRIEGATLGGGAAKRLKDLAADALPVHVVQRGLDVRRRRHVRRCGCQGVGDPAAAAAYTDPTATATAAAPAHAAAGCCTGGSKGVVHKVRHGGARFCAHANDLRYGRGGRRCRRWHCRCRWRWHRCRWHRCCCCCCCCCCCGRCHWRHGGIATRHHRGCLSGHCRCCADGGGGYGSYVGTSGGARRCIGRGRRHALRGCGGPPLTRVPPLAAHIQHRRDGGGLGAGPTHAVRQLGVVRQVRRRRCRRRRRHPRHPLRPCRRRRRRADALLGRVASLSASSSCRGSRGGSSSSGSSGAAFAPPTARRRRGRRRGGYR